MTSRRRFLRNASLAVMGATAVERSSLAALPDAPTRSDASTAKPHSPPNGRPYRPARRAHA